MSVLPQENERIRVIWTDLMGIARGVVIPNKHFDSIAEHGAGSANAEIELSLNRTIPSDSKYGPQHGNVQAIPDLDSSLPIEWEKGTSAIFCDLKNPDGSVFELCSRSLLKDVVNKFEKEDYGIHIGVEIEFSLIRETDGGYVPFNNLSSNSIDGIEDASTYINKITELMVSSGYDILGVHQEGQPGQYEFNIAHQDPVSIADGIMYFRHLIKSVSHSENVRSTLMPRPHEGEEANGMHFHVSIMNNNTNENIFNGDANDSDLGISEDARGFIGGILRHMKPLTAICAPTVNSYKRLIPGLWAPINITWGPDNRSTVIRIPQERGSNTRIELRVPDTTCNPYLGISANLLAGLEGLRDGVDPGKPTTDNAYHQEFEQLPRTLWSALDHLEDSRFLKENMNEGFVDEYIKLKRDEFNRYQNSITNWEREEYIGEF